MRSHFLTGCMVAAVGCTPKADAPSPKRTDVHVVEPAPAATAVDASARSTPENPPRPIADDAALEEGLVSFVGMVRPTKGGLDVRGVTIALETLHQAFPRQSDVPGYDELLGTRLRIVADLVQRGSEEESDSGELAIQRRSGRWFGARTLVSAEVVSEAEQIEGEVARSKGLYAVGKHLVARGDLNWSLFGKDPVGKRVRLWGQSRTVVCPPRAQCLIGGSLPMFDVARAEFVP